MRQHIPSRVEIEVWPIFEDLHFAPCGGSDFVPIDKAEEKEEIRLTDWSSRIETGFDVIRRPIIPKVRIKIRGWLRGLVIHEKDYQSMPVDLGLANPGARMTRYQKTEQRREMWWSGSSAAQAQAKHVHLIESPFVTGKNLGPAFASLIEQAIDRARQDGCEPDLYLEIEGDECAIWQDRGTTRASRIEAEKSPIKKIRMRLSSSQEHPGLFCGWMAEDMEDARRLGDPLDVPDLAIHRRSKRACPCILPSRIKAYTPVGNLAGELAFELDPSYIHHHRGSQKCKMSDAA